MDNLEIPQVAGLKALQLRNLLRSLMHSEFELTQLTHLLGQAGQGSDGVLQSLMEVGLVMHQGREGTAGLFLVSDLGTRVANAHFSKRIKRKTADHLLKGVLSRARQINRKRGLTHKVQLIRVFGSYVSSSETLGDLDLSVSLEPTTRDWVRASLERAYESGRTFRNFGEKINYGPQEVLKTLKNRSPYISIHTGDEIERFSVPYEVVFQGS